MHADTLENIINAMNNLKYDEDTIDYANIDGCQEADHNNTIDMCIKIVKDMLSESHLNERSPLIKNTILNIVKSSLEQHGYYVCYNDASNILHVYNLDDIEININLVIPVNTDEKELS